jgi:hypothetical protein
MFDIVVATLHFLGFDQVDQMSFEKIAKPVALCIFLSKLRYVFYREKKMPIIWLLL